MKFLIKLVLGMVIFNAFLVLLSGFFPTGTQHTDAQDLTEDGEYDAGLGLMDLVYDYLLNMQTLAIFSVLLLFGGALGIATGRNMPLYIGLALVLSLISSLYLSTIKVFVAITNDPYVRGVFMIITLVIGLITLFSVSDYLSGRQDVE